MAMAGFGGGGDRNQRSPTRAEQLKGTWLTGPGRLKKKTRGKGGDPERVVYDPKYKPKVAQKTAVGGKKSPKAKVYAAGSNVLDREKRLTYDEMLKQGTRADDPRNWEFHYKEPAQSFMSGNYTAGTKGMTGDERRTQAFSNARMRAEKQAKLTGKDVYQVKKLEYETETTRGETKQNIANRKAIGRFGSTRAAKGVAAQKELAQRRIARGRARTTDAFESAEPKKKRIA